MCKGGGNRYPPKPAGSPRAAKASVPRLSQLLLWRADPAKPTAAAKVKVVYSSSSPVHNDISDNAGGE
ncbi:hypothetical protein NDU88_001266 [Pleurodeles waltl]|uniref:Uncharacterized protein n=1 Tax=Pleurodeles waltl TaxID=8319 RepID=A0AAV7M0P5_PLEWA|nr:hypothetical protein NDU88_001266 [Pleurodeles waltl]